MVDSALSLIWVLVKKKLLNFTILANIEKIPKPYFNDKAKPLYVFFSIFYMKN
ncbi:hypothetical protein HMPREF9444_01487 [Succinatimonas hippei YIT 12066]|uniref:Uncharacterized protein n=1 Tax=Succinatimonas hippei (strain DSM 22608 / JCM 16073 / KCTC 15190 / YIT 12066) TaxID=762983 RepID=E8LL81_SUCHY|nr:hypothetical protein HMPREF9444_01487 [Succinatimonas hippei YIT 12066]